MLTACSTLQSQQQKRSIGTIVNNAPFWSYIIDESTDKGIIKQLGNFVRYVNLPTSRDLNYFPIEKCL